jgi:uncharacterized protein (TIGR02680 family)
VNPESLPQPTNERWTPLRLGLTELYYYDDEQFWFRDGRLLLRGNNGTGKSKVLALTLPFLFDASLLPARVEPDADRAKKMKWNLLLDKVEDHDERTGYTWLEFGRRDPATGKTEFFTLGCGLKATKGNDTLRHWFFTTPRRIGDLKLVDSATSIVLSRERLREELTADGEGRVFENDSAGYRRAVDDKLFKLGPDRYAGLVDLLIQLRQPQLSVKPNEAKLSGALTNSLAPLAPEVLADLAESFRALDEDKRRLEELEGIGRAVRRFLRVHERYARALARIRAEHVRRAHSVQEALRRDLVAQQAEVAAAGESIGALEDEQRKVQLDVTQFAARRDALQDSAAWGEARNLEELHKAADAARSRLQGAQVALERATQAVASAERDAAEAAGRLGRGETEEATARAESFAAAGEAGLGDDHDVALVGRDQAARILGRRHGQADHMAEAVESARAAQTKADQARERASEAESEEARRRKVRERADAAAGEAGEALIRASQAYLASLEALALADPDDALAQVERWAADPEGWEYPLAGQVAKLAEEALARIAALRQRLETELDEQRSVLVERREHLATLEAGTAPVPPPRPTRRQPTADESARPLFELADFADGVEPAARAGLEAALEAAGLLDAWVRPDGSVTDPVTGDLLLEAMAAEASPAWPTLADVLIPADASAEIVRGVLRGIGLGEGSGPVWVAPDGAFALGSARGAWAKSEAQFIGAAAREKQRLAAIEEAKAQIDVIEQAIAGLVAALAQAAADAERVRNERGALPSREPQTVAQAVHDARVAVREELAASERAREAAVAAARAQDDAVSQRGRADGIGQDLGIEPSERGVARLRTALASLESALAETRGAVRRTEDLRAAARSARELADSRTQEEAERRDAYRRGEEEDLVAAERLATLQAVVGPTVAELNAELAALDQQREQATGRLETIAKERLAAENRLGAAQAKCEQLELRRADATARREELFDRLRRFAELSLLRIAVPTVEVGGLDSANAVVTLARRIEAELADVAITEDALDDLRRRNSAAVNELRSELGVYSHPVEAVEHADGEEVRVRYGERELAADELAASVGEAIEVKKRTLSAREREILENYLMADTAGQLADLMVQAETWVRALNREMGARGTSTGMKLRLRWDAKPDAPVGFEQVRRLLLRAGAVWDESERGVIGEFLQRAIDQERADDPAAGWDDHLSKAFDYRQWHTFKVERSQGSNWLSGAGPASTGERALTLTLPLFAAAASYYSTAGNRDAPRLILLDEAFAGIDNEARAGAMGLFREFDLDAVMTSEREWGCYPSVPGLSIAHLSRQEGVNAVGVSRWEWDGAERSAGSEPPPDGLAWERGGA